MAGKRTGRPACLTTPRSACRHSLPAGRRCTESAGKLLGDDPGTPAGVGDIFRGDLEYVFGCLKDAWKQAYGLSGVIATAAVSVALVVADAAVALVESVLAGVDAVRYFSGYQITVTSLGPPCAPREFLPQDGNGQKWTMLNYACLDGYALALAKTTFTTGDSPPEDGVATFRS